MIRPYDAWILARLRVGESLDGELHQATEWVRSLADALARISPDGHQVAWDAVLAARPDAGEIHEALARVDPCGPAPNPDADEQDDAWPPLRIAELPRVEPFPIEVLPEAAARLVREGSEAIGCPPDFLGLYVLAVVAGVTGRSVSLLVKEGYFAKSSIFAAVVGPPSDGKTPALKVVADAVRRIDAILEDEYASTLRRWEQAASELGPDGKKVKPPPTPRPRRIDVDDITMEAIPPILADNERGLIMIRDELSALLLGMNQYKGGKGNDRFCILKIWSGDAIKKDRVNHEANIPIRCPHPCMTIVGGMTPDLLGELIDAEGRADGFIDRFLVCYPDPRPVPYWTDRGVTDEAADDWSRIVARLWSRPLKRDGGRTIPHVAHFTLEGRACWVSHFNNHAAEMNAADFPPNLRSPWGKFKEYAGRLTLALAMVHHAADPTADPEVVPMVGPRTVDDAWHLIGYFKGHARRVRAAIAQGRGIAGGQVVPSIIGWLREGNRRSFSERDIKQARRGITDADLADALKFLSGRNAIRRREAASDDRGPGRPSSPVYDVNPALLET